MTESKTYKLPDELQQLGDELAALEELRDKYVSRPFGYKKAKKAAKEYQKTRNKFWRSVYELYPNASGKLSYDSIEGVIKDNVEAP